MKMLLDTIILFVRDVEKLKQFYAGVLNLSVIEEDAQQWVLLNAGNANIGLHKIGEHYLEAVSNGYKFDGNTKIVFAIEDDIKLVRQQLLNHNVAMQEVKTFEGYDYLVCDGEDPEGNVFQLKQRKPKV